VRKAGVAAAARLLRALPGEPGLAALWVRAALPAVRDAEASLQELVLDQAGALLSISDMRVPRCKNGMLQSGTESSITTLWMQSRLQCRSCVSGSSAHAPLHGLCARCPTTCVRLCLRAPDAWPRPPGSSMSWSYAARRPRAPRPGAAARRSRPTPPLPPPRSWRRCWPRWRRPARPAPPARAARARRCTRAAACGRRTWPRVCSGSSLAWARPPTGARGHAQRGGAWSQPQGQSGSTGQASTAQTPSRRGEADVVHLCSTLRLKAERAC